MFKRANNVFWFLLEVYYASINHPSYQYWIDCKVFHPHQFLLTFSCTIFLYHTILTNRMHKSQQCYKHIDSQPYNNVLGTFLNWKSQRKEEYDDREDHKHEVHHQVSFDEFNFSLLFLFTVLPGQKIFIAVVGYSVISNYIPNLYFSTIIIDVSKWPTLSEIWRLNSIQIH